MLKTTSAGAMVCVALLAGGCGRESPADASTGGAEGGAASETYTIATTFYPTTYFARRDRKST
ncbi:MAG: hypothetical protein ACF8Q5_02050, partial [Phycisphaerales bacterium JB040]